MDIRNDLWERGKEEGGGVEGRGLYSSSDNGGGLGVNGMWWSVSVPIHQIIAQMVKIKLHAICLLCYFS